MENIKAFVLSLVGVSAASALIDSFVPDGGMKKYIRYLVSLMLILVLAAPFRGMIGTLLGFTYNGTFSYDTSDVAARADSVIAMHVERAVRGKFSIADSEIDAKTDGETIILRIRSRPWLFESDIESYAQNNFGVDTEVIFYE